ncbi:MAG: hypothetical protein R2739_05200 [Chitinophagales bacterium]|nr:hypothetical protein [Bacteroidota bacterium]
MEKKLLYGWMYEFIWIAASCLVAYILLFPVQEEISTALYQFIGICITMVFIYFHFVAFLSRSIILESIWMKLIVFILNIPLFLFVLNKYYEYGRVYDEYNYTLPATMFQHIKSGTELNDVLYIKNLIIFGGVAFLFLIILLELRIVRSIFLSRQLDAVIYKNRKKQQN